MKRLWKNTRRNGDDAIFIDLDRAFDKILRQEVRRCLKKIMPEKYVKLITKITQMCKRVKTSMHDSFECESWVASRFRFLLFNVVFDMLI